MPIQAARAFNRTCPKGTFVEATLRDGTKQEGKTKGPAIVWAGYALVEVEGWPSYWTVEAVKPRIPVVKTGDPG
jgi:hypothetical protein